LRILVKVKVEYHEVYGLSLIICDIDPSYTIGEMALKRQLIIRKLEEEGVFGMNKETAFPLVPQRIAVISSKNAAGYTDFLRHLNGNSFGYVFYTTLFDTVVQGNETEESVVSSLEKIASEIDRFDIVVIIRGGGSQTDLSWFDNYNIAYYVTQFPLPVVTGIGHDKDISVTDMVAYESLRTPTAVADFLINCVNMTEGHIMQLARNITDASGRILERSRSSVSALMSKLHPVARLRLAHVREDLSEKIIEIVSTGKEYIMKAGLKPANQKSRLISAASNFSATKSTAFKNYCSQLVSFTNSLMKSNLQKISSIEKTLEIVRPENVLKRGYTITSLKGRIIKSSTEISRGDVIDTSFSDGTVKSEVI
jgi:exodeoxyribonuclease VII large subunit